MNITGEFKIKSIATGFELTFSPEDAEFEVESVEDRQMGPERQYVWQTEYQESNETIEITYEVWEYPEGSKNHQSVEVPGFSVLTEFDFDFNEPQ